MPEEEGKWVTINGTHVLIKDGETPEQALARLNDKSKGKIYRVLKDESTEEYSIQSVKCLTEKQFEQYKKTPDYEKFKNQIKEWSAENAQPFIDELNEKLQTFDYEHRPYWQLVNQVVGYSNEYLKTYLNEIIADHQEKRAQEYISSIPKHKDAMPEESLVSINREHWLESAAISVPPYDNRALAYFNNCQRCVQAFVMRYCHGLDVEALPCDDYYDNKGRELDGPIGDLINNYALRNSYLSGWNSIIFCKQDVMDTFMDGEELTKQAGYSGTEDQLRLINRKVKESGPGSCWIIGVTYKGGKCGHTICAINDNGKVKYIDPQDGKESTVFKNKLIRPKDTTIFRADNCRLNGDMMKYIFKKGGNE